MGANVIYDLAQQSPEWMEMRKGMCTGSMVRHAIAKMKRQPKEGPTVYMQCREDYMIDIVTTRITGRMSDRYVSKAMEDGIERESIAVAKYEHVMGVEVENVGFAFHPQMEWYGASPDGLVGSDIVLEVKCPTAATHIRYILEAQDAKAKQIAYVPEEYLPQVKAEIACTERLACHFVSYNPDFPKNLQLLICEWRRDREMIEQQDAEVRKFLDEATQLEKQLKAMKL
jgi:hypothetical protein